jgi:hypothetical protein
MATVDDTKAQKILMYLWANGFKSTNLADGAGTGIGADTIQFLRDQGHTVTSQAQKYLLSDNKYGGIGIATSTFSTLIGNPWVSNTRTDLEMIAGVFGLTRDEVDTLYSNGVLRLGVPVPAKKGGKGRSKKSKQFNRDGWSAININAIAETGSVDSNWTKAVKDNASGSSTMQVVTNTDYMIGSALGNYGRSIPTVIPAGVAPSAPPVTAPATPPAEEEEEEIAPPTPAPPSEFEKYLNTTDVSVWWNDGLPSETIEESEREVSSKAWNASRGIIDIGDAPLRVRVPINSNYDNQWNPDYLQMLVTNGDIDNDDLAEYMASATNLEEVIDEDENEYDVIPSPEVSFFFEKGEMYIEIEGYGMVPGSKAFDKAQYSVLEIVMDEPSAGGAIVDIRVNKSSFAEVLKMSEGVYGFPYAGIEGLENRFKTENYSDEGAGNTAEQQALRALSNAYIKEGVRKITFEPTISDIEFDKSTLPDDVLQPLALDFDTPLDLDTQGVFFTLNYETSKDASNLFPGFNINDNSDSNNQEFMFPFDIRNLKPVNEDGKVLSPDKRDVGEGIVSIKVASKNAVKGNTLKIGSKTYDVVTYSQVKLTTTDGDSILIPDLDERFKALDNQNQEIAGTVNVIDGRPAMMVITGKLDVADIEKYLTNSRRSSRLSAKYNAIDELTGQVDTKTIMVQQDNDYIIVVGIGSTTYALKIRGD